MKDIFKVAAPGPYTTVQDRGRYGYQQFGIPPTGALDQFAFCLANLLVGNPKHLAVLEFTFIGARLEVLGEANVAVTGAEVSIEVNSKSLQEWSSFNVKSGDVLNIGQVKSGCRAYLAVTGGIEVPLLMGSRSTYVAARIGGYQGRLLEKDDVLSRGEGLPLRAPRALPSNFIPQYASEILLMAIPGPQDDFFDKGLSTLFESEFTVSSQANRMGYRLKGTAITHREGVPKSIISEPSVVGGIQIPPDGEPIILLVEQTVGGYTKIATVISADIPKVAQAKPGDKIRFEQVSLESAHAVFHRQHGLIEKVEDHLLSSH